MPTNWINNDVSLDLYSFDNGYGIKLLTTYSGSKEWNKKEFDPSVNTEQVQSSKYMEQYFKSVDFNNSSGNNTIIITYTSNIQQKQVLNLLKKRLSF